MLKKIILGGLLLALVGILVVGAYQSHGSAQR